MRLTSAARLGLFLAATMAAPLAVATTLTDISDIPEQAAINYLLEHNIIGGYPDGTFRPEKTVNRAELVKILVAREGTHPSQEKYRDCFPDVTSEWFAPYVCYAKEQGWVSGYPDGMFRPGNTVNAAEAIKMIMIAIGFRPNQSSAASSIAGVEPGVWYAPYVEAALQHRLLPSANLDPGADMKREDVVAVVYRSLIQSSSGGGDAHTNVLSGRLRRGGGNSTDETDIHVPVITFADISKTYGDASFTLSALSNSLGPITYTSSNTSVATINGSTVTIVGAGSSTITATQAANARFVGNTATAVLTVNGTAPTITFGDLTKSYIDANFTLSPTSDSPGAFTFTSGNLSLVSISGNTADIVGTHGTVTITANQAASGNFAAGTASMTLTVFVTYCVSSPCLFGGECVPTLEGALTDDNFVCICPEDTSGDTCEMYDDACEEPSYCNSGECIPDASGGSCGNCAPCLTGDRCQTAIINCESRLPVLLACVDPAMSWLH